MKEWDYTDGRFTTPTERVFKMLVSKGVISQQEVDDLLRLPDELI